MRQAHEALIHGQALDRPMASNAGLLVDGDVRLGQVAGPAVQHRFDVVGAHDLFVIVQRYACAFAHHFGDYIGG